MVISRFPTNHRRARERLLTKLRQLPAATRRERARKSIRFTAETYFPHIFNKPWGDFHLRALDRINDPENRRLADAFPRFHGKSMMYSVLTPIQKVAILGFEGWLCISLTIKLSRDWIAKIRHELTTNQLLIDDFHIPPPDQWISDNREEIKLPDGRYIFAKGRGYQVRGFHPPGITVDDIDNDFTATSDIELDKTDRWFKRGLINTLGPKGYLYFIGTIISNRCQLKRILDLCADEDSVWKGELLAASPDKPLWEAVWDKKALTQRRELILERAFSQEFLNAPMSEHGKLFTSVPTFALPEDPKKRLKWLQGCNLFMTVDWAATEKQRNDQTAIVVAAMDHNSNIYVIDTLAAHMVPDKAIDAVVRMYDKWNRLEHPILRMGIEKQVMGHVYATMLQSWQRDTGQFLPVFPVSPRSRSDYARIQPIQDRAARGKFFIGPDHWQLRDQLLNFGDSDRDDLAAATAYLEQTCFPPHLVGEEKAEKSSTETLEKSHDEVWKRFGPPSGQRQYHEVLGAW